MKDQKAYQWKKRQAQTALIIYSALSITLSILEFQINIGYASSLDKHPLMLLPFITTLFVGFCMATEKGLWQLWEKILFIPLSLLLQFILYFPAVLLGLLVGSLTRNWSLAIIATIVFASLPVWVFGMKQSKIFMELKEG